MSAVSTVDLTANAPVRSGLDSQSASEPSIPLGPWSLPRSEGNGTATGQVSVGTDARNATERCCPATFI